MFEDTPLSKKSDVYSIGNVYYYMLYGKTPSSEEI
jgi:serine/threonine protein kinase